MIDYATIPPLVRAAIDRYVKDHVKCGDFTMSVLRNDLREAVPRADDDSFAALRSIVCYCHNEIPGPCWGSPAKVEAWLAMASDESLKRVVDQTDAVIGKLCPGLTKP